MGGDGEKSLERDRHRVVEAYDRERRKAQADRGARALDANDVDGWKLERPQLDLAEEVDDDLLELQVLLGCCERDGNRHRISAAILEFEVKARVRRTWAWFPLERYEWSGHEYAEPKVKLSFKVPGAGALPARDVHCDFGTDWFDLKVWNVVWPESPEVKYHHRVKKTRLMRNIVPSQCTVEATGDRVLVGLQKVLDPTHGYCAWASLVAGTGRKPFKCREDAPDGGLMEFFEGEYEKYEGHDGYRRDIGRAMEQVHRGAPVRGVPSTPGEE